MTVSRFNAGSMHHCNGVAELAVALRKYHLPRARCSNQIACLRSPVHSRMEPRDLQYWVHLLAECENNFAGGMEGEFRFAQDRTCACIDTQRGKQSTICDKQMPHNLLLTPVGGTREHLA